MKDEQVTTNPSTALIQPELGVSQPVLSIPLQERYCMKDLNYVAEWEILCQWQGAAAVELLPDGARGPSLILTMGVFCWDFVRFPRWSVQERP